MPGNSLSLSHSLVLEYLTRVSGVAVRSKTPFRSRLQCVARVSALSLTLIRPETRQPRREGERERGGESPIANASDSSINAHRGNPRERFSLSRSVSKTTSKKVVLFVFLSHPQSLIPPSMSRLHERNSVQLSWNIGWIIEDGMSGTC